MKTSTPCFLICDSDESYGKKIYEGFRKALCNRYEVLFCSNVRFAEENVCIRNVEIMLISENLRKKFIGPVFPKTTIYMTTLLSVDDEWSVYKYQSFDKLMHDVMRLCAIRFEKEEGYVQESFCKSKLIGIYSPIKRCFQTTFCIALGQMLARDYKTLYLNFESFSGFKEQGISTGKGDLSDLIYFLSLGEETFSFRLNSVIERVGALDFIPPSTSYIAFETTTKNEWLSFLNTLEQKSSYDYILLDLSENVCGLFDILRRCRKVFTIMGEDAVSVAKLGQYESMLKQGLYDDLLSVTKKIHIPNFKEIPIEFEMLPYSELASFTKKLIQEGI